MRKAKDEVLVLGEYIITMEYDGNGKLDIIVFDELGEEIEGLFISNSDEIDDD